MTSDPDAKGNSSLANLPSLPRYTSYPPANHFQAGLGASLEDAFIRAMAEAKSLSVYAHIPYCDRLCWFCGCHTKQTLSYEPIRAYVPALCTEIGLLRQRLPRDVPVTRIHLGGGSPSLLRAEELTNLRNALARNFDVRPDAEISIEIDPSDLKPESMDGLLAFGLNRASIGVQDFDPLVQEAINRPQSFEITKAAVDRLRAAGITSINMDLLYGLPHQTLPRLQDTVAKVLSMAPDRIALFGYAHVPWIKTHQRLIPEDALPGIEDRLIHARAAAEQIMAAGYVAIGIDHFAKPGDGLAKAAAAGQLHRNFQGYTDDGSDVLVGLGTSSIGRFAGGYLQNAAATGRYLAAIAAGKLTYDRGFGLTLEDQARAWVIERLMCDFAFSRADLECAYPDNAKALWHEAWALAQSKFKSIVTCDDARFVVPPEQRHLARYVASSFDTYLDAKPFQYSKAV